MNYNNNLDLDRPICVGIGLVALDVLFNGKPNTPIGCYAGGSCGNVMAILSYLGWQTFPVARLKNNDAAYIVLKDLEHFGVNNSFISLLEDGSTPIIIHRVLKDKAGNPKHRFEFRNPENGSYLPSYKPVLSAHVNEIFERKPKSNIFYLDRVSRASIEMARKSKDQNTIVFFEPSSYKDDKNHSECMSNADIVKFANDRIANYDELFPICKRELEIRTMGPDGLVYRTKSQTRWTHIKAYDINCVVDAAGSGDWCTAGIIFSLFTHINSSVIYSDKVETALKFGQALAALNCSFLGARGAMYTMSKDIFWRTVNNILLARSDSNQCSYLDYSMNSSIIEEFNLRYLY